MDLINNLLVCVAALLANKDEYYTSEYGIAVQNSEKCLQHV